MVELKVALSIASIETKVVRAIVKFVPPKICEFAKKPRFPVSARSPLAMQTVIKQLGIKCPLSAFNGALILNEEGVQIYSKPLPLAEAREIVKELNDLTSVTWNIYSDLSWLTQKPKTQALLAEEKIVKLCAKAIDVSEIENLKCIHKVLVMGPKNILDELLKIYSQRYSNLYLVKSKDTLLEIVASGVEKADSIKRVSDYYHVEISNTLAFGDNYNDERMLKTVGKGYLMGNAPEELKKHYPYITADYNHDGIAEVLENLEN